MTKKARQCGDLCGVFARKSAGQKNGHRAFATIKQESECGGFFFEPVRSTLVAPILPEPMVRRLPRPMARDTITPKGTEPRR